MAKTVMQDPLTSEARSSWLAGVTEGLSKISDVLNMKTGTFENYEMSELFISEDDRYRIYNLPLGNKVWVSSPEPVFKKNGVVITPVEDNFTIDYLGGSIAFEPFARLTADDVVTVDATYILADSDTINTINSKLANMIPINTTVTLSSDNWTEEDNGDYTQIVPVIGVIANSEKQNIFVSPTPTKVNIDNLKDYTIYCSEQGNGTLTFVSSEIQPTVNVQFNVEIYNL